MSFFETYRRNSRSAIADHGAAFEVEPNAVASFRERGFALIPSVAEPHEVARLRPIFDRLFDERVGRAAGAHYDIVGDDGDEGGATWAASGPRSVARCARCSDGGSSGARSVACGFGVHLARPCGRHHTFTILLVESVELRWK